jgi:retron-type reverse transcriptase
MKRQNCLFEKVIDYQNIRLAFLKAVRGKRFSAAVIKFCANTDSNLKKIREELVTLQCGWGNYRSFTITDPKPRIISSAPLPQRIMHHALMNILEPVFERPMIHHSYACRKGKGTHAALQYAFDKCKAGLGTGAHTWFLKLDVRKFFDSVDHAALKEILSALIKDVKVLYLLFEIIDSYHTLPGKWLPIGNLTSQYFANLYLAGLDHYILEKLHPAGYVRYMDDCIVWSDSKQKLQTMLERIETYTGEQLKLNLKPPVIGRTEQGLPFLGFLIKSTGIYLMHTSKRRVRNRVKTIQWELAYGIIDEAKAAERVLSVHAAIAPARTRSFRKKLWGAAAQKKLQGSNRVLRGGDWNNNASNAAVSNRNNNNPNDNNNNIGFRVVCPPNSADRNAKKTTEQAASRRENRTPCE